MQLELPDLGKQNSEGLGGGGQGDLKQIKIFPSICYQSLTGDAEVGQHGPFLYSNDVLCCFLSASYFCQNPGCKALGEK